MTSPGNRPTVRNATIKGAGCKGAGTKAAATKGVTIAAALLLATTPATAARFVQFAFTAEGQAAHGTYVLDCPPGAGNCAVTDIKGMYGAEKLSLTPLKPPPVPPTPPPPVNPDNQLTQPDYKPTDRGTGMNHGNSFFNIFTDLSLPGSNPLVHWRRYAPDTGEITGEIPILDYQVSVPEPGAWLLMLGGFGFIGLAVRRRRRLLTLTA
jgi:hypothetical protein